MPHKARVTKGVTYFYEPFPGHFRVTRNVNRKIPYHLREWDGIYGDEGAWAKLCVAMPALFTREEQILAWDTLRDQFPEVYKEEVQQLLKAFERRSK